MFESLSDKLQNIARKIKGTEGIAQQYLFHWRRMQDR
jgi:hypothetical protein